VPVKQLVGYVPESPRLYEFLTGIEYLDFVGDIYGIQTAEKKDRINEYLRAFQLEGREGDIITGYSEGMKQIEAVLMRTWGQMGLVKTKKIAADTTAQPKNIAYPTDGDLLHRIREKIVQKIKRVRQEVTLRKPFRPFSRVSKRILLGIKKFYRRDPEKRRKATQALRKIVTRVHSLIH
jgi:hypothetical protein